MGGLDLIAILPYLAAGALALSVVTGAVGWFKGNASGKATVRAEWEAERVKDRASVDAANLAANRSALRYEEARTALRTRVITVTKEVNRALETAPVWRDSVVPDSVRDSLAAAASDSAASQPHRAMPSASAASAANERRSGTGLRFGAGWLGRLSSPASSPD